MLLTATCPWKAQTAAESRALKTFGHRCLGTTQKTALQMVPAPQTPENQGVGLLGLARKPLILAFSSQSPMTE